MFFIFVDYRYPKLLYGTDQAYLANISEAGDVPSLFVPTTFSGGNLFNLS